MAENIGEKQTNKETETVDETHTNKSQYLTKTVLDRGRKEYGGKQRNQEVFNVFYQIRGIKNKFSTDIGTIILLGLMIILFIISVTGFIVMWFTEYYNEMWVSKLVLVNNSEAFEQWQNPSSEYDTFLKVHIFNYTNINKYLTGQEEKIKISDIGPLTYKEHTTKVNVAFNNNFTVTFREHRSYTFLPEKSTCGEHEKFILPNVPLLTAAVKVEKFSGLKKLAAVHLINSFKEDLFKKLSAHEFLWGYRDKIVALDIGTGASHFGLLMNRNGTSPDSIQLNTGEDDIQKFGTIAQFNGEPYLNFWNDENCNRINGSDATMFPPHLLENRETLSVFLQVLCRKIPLQFEQQLSIYNDIDVLRYKTTKNVFGNPEENPENLCYCRNTQRCMPSGVINATKCYNGAPIYPSFPHFFSGDPEIYKEFDGIEPNPQIHQTYADLHPRFAFPISGASRIQINIGAYKTSLTKNKIGRIQEGTILPLIWLEITSGDFTDDVINKLYVSTFGLNAIQCALKYGTLLTCVTSFIVIAAGFYTLSQKYDQEVLETSKDIVTITE